MDGRIHDEQNAMTIARWPSASETKKLSFANTFNLDKVLILSFGKVLNGHFQTRNRLKLIHFAHLVCISKADRVDQYQTALLVQSDLDLQKLLTLYQGLIESYCLSATTMIINQTTPFCTA